MSDVIAGITISVDGYYTGPEDGPGQGLGIGGEKLHYWVFGGPWTYEEGPGSTEEYRSWLEDAIASIGAVVGGRGVLEAADRWGGTNPWGVPFFIVTHRPNEQPEPSAGFTFVDDLETAVDRARAVAGDKDVNIMGGGDIIRQAMTADIVDRLSLVIAPVILGGGKRLFDGFEKSLDLEHLEVRQSAFATFIDYRLVG